MKLTYIHGHKVQYEDNAYSGIYHLQTDLNAQEANVFFNEAKSRHTAPFEDDNEHHFILTHNSDGSYLLERKG